MPNPFISAPFVDSLIGLFGRSEQENTLRSFVQNRKDCVLFGPEGSGKSALLNAFFNHDYRVSMAEENVLIYIGSYPTYQDTHDTYDFFCNGIQSAVENLALCGRTELMNTLLARLDSIRADTMAARFIQSLDKLRTFGMRVVFVLDNFENFTSSPKVTPAHHDVLCGLLNSAQLQLIVASNYDFNETSLPEGIRNSTLLTRLGPNAVTMTPLSVDECTAMLECMAQSVNQRCPFDTEQMKALRRISGGIPLLLQMAAKHGYHVLQERAPDFEEEVLRRTLYDALPILKHWCTVTPHEQLELLHELKERTHLSELLDPTAKKLLARGLLCAGTDWGRNGQLIYTQGYIYNSSLFRTFCANEAWLNEVRLNNPLRKEPQLPVIDIGSVFEDSRKPQEPQQPIINITGPVYVQNGGTVIAGDAGASLFGFLDLNRWELAGQLSSRLSAPALTPGLTEAEYEDLVEERAEEISSIFIPKALEESPEEVIQAQEETLETSFAAARGKVDPNGLLTAELLESLTPKCRMYLKIAVVVDERLSGLEQFLSDDLSAQMIMYGKVLEQQLKDNFYRLFSTDETLQKVNVNERAPHNPKVARFQGTPMNNTTPFFYLSLMHSHSYYLYGLSSKHSISFDRQVLGKSWWEQLSADINTAKNLRNGSGHSGLETHATDLAQMRELLFGEGRMLHRIATGNRLYQAVTAPKPSFQRGTANATMADIAYYKGRLVEMTNIEVTGRESIRGTIVGTRYGVTVAKKQLDRKHCYAPDLVGQTIQVRIREWNKGGTVFDAELP